CARDRGVIVMGYFDSW
nr:immunoglobulin heavy chain junction region [Macaca mulatta]